MTPIERLREQADWAIIHPEPRVWGDMDVTYTPLMTVDPLRVIALLDVAEAARFDHSAHRLVDCRGCDALARLDGAS